MNGMQSKHEAYLKMKSYVETRFPEIYPFQIENGQTFFSLPDGSGMKIVLLNWQNENYSLVMDYSSADECDDGDQYCIEEYDSPEALFEVMLAETEL